MQRIALHENNHFKNHVAADIQKTVSDLWEICRATLDKPSESLNVRHSLDIT